MRQKGKRGIIYPYNSCFTERGLAQMKMEIIRGTARTILEYDNPVLLSTVFAQHGVGVEMPCGGRQR